MKINFDENKLQKIKKQAVIYQCACPASIADSLLSTRALYRYQEKCEEFTTTDLQVHKRIKASVERVHKELEECLEDVLRLEGWDMETLTMPDNLRKTMIDAFVDK